jgi:Starch-binding associating with outer membrane
MKTKKVMKTLKYIFGCIFFISTSMSCKKYLDINNDPSSPQTPSLQALFIPVTSCMSRTIGLDGRQAGSYIQNWSGTAVQDNYDTHGGNAGSSANSQAWRDFYTTQGTAINLILKQGVVEQQWDFVGAATALRAWGLQNATDYFGEMPYTQAWEPNRVYFEYDRQEDIYDDVDSLCRVAINYLDRTDGKVSQIVMGRGDLVYGGNRDKWKRFAYGVLARNWHHQTNKGNYNADSVIAYVDKSMQTNSDNFNVIHSATKNDDTNPFGPARDNFYTRRQSRFIVQLLDGTSFYNSTIAANRDPRLSKMLSVSPDTLTLNTNMPTLNGGYRFFIPASGYTISTNVTTNAYKQTPSTFYGDSNILNTDAASFAVRKGKYIFQNSAAFPIMTAFEMQFIKAEAAFRKGDLNLAQTTYKNAIGLHIDFVNTINLAATGVTQISSADKLAYLNSPAVKQSGLSITLTDIMLQKYIADFGWNLIESWCDMRRYHYFDIDPSTTQQVYRGFTIPLFNPINLGPKPAYRLRPTSASEYDWNLVALQQIGALNQDYHTYEMWFSQP